MMMNNPQMEVMEMQARRSELLRQARLSHLTREAAKDAHIRPHRWLLLVSDLMIGAGMRLRAHAAPADLRLVAKQSQ